MQSVRARDVAGESQGCSCRFQNQALSPFKRIHEGIKPGDSRLQVALTYQFRTQWPSDSPAVWGILNVAYVNTPSSTRMKVRAFPRLMSQAPNVHNLQLLDPATKLEQSANGVGIEKPLWPNPHSSFQASCSSLWESNALNVVKALGYSSSLRHDH
jgi:hypothetical protein